MHSAKIVGPPAEWMAPSTPPPRSDLFAAFADHVHRLGGDVAENELNVDVRHAGCALVPRRDDFNCSTTSGGDFPVAASIERSARG